MALIETWEKVLEYASSPQHGTLSRKQRKGVTLQINGSDLFDGAVIFIGENYIRLTETKGSEVINAYYDLEKIGSIKTISNTDKQ